jgi:hypothetical protein
LLPFRKNRSSPLCRKVLIMRCIVACMATDYNMFLMCDVIWLVSTVGCLVASIALCHRRAWGRALYVWTAFTSIALTILLPFRLAVLISLPFTGLFVALLCSKRSHGRSPYIAGTHGAGLDSNWRSRCLVPAAFFCNVLRGKPHRLATATNAARTSCEPSYCRDESRFSLESRFRQRASARGTAA